MAQLDALTHMQRNCKNNKVRSIEDQCDNWNWSTLPNHPWSLKEPEVENIIAGSVIQTEAKCGVHH